MEDFVTFEIAKKLKEKGFREDCIAQVKPDNTIIFNHVFDNDIRTIIKCHNKLKPYVDAPTISQVMKWLREEKNIILTPNPSYFKEDCCLGWDCDVWAYGNYNHCFVDYKTYEQATIAGIEYVLDNLI